MEDLLVSYLDTGDWVMKKLLTMLVLGIALQAQAEDIKPTFAAYEKAYEQDLAKVEADNKKAVEALPDQYVQSLKNLEQKFQKAGDLDSLVLVKTEEARFAKARKVSAEVLVPTVSELAVLQSRVIQVSSNIEVGRCKKVIALVEKYIAGLEELKKSLTKQGRLDDALLTKEEIERAGKRPEVTAARFTLSDAGGKVEPAEPAEAKETSAAGSGSLPQALRNHLVLHYSFDKDEGGKVMDQSGKGNDGRMSNAKGTPKGKTGWACEFDGQAAVVNAGHDPSLDITRDLTISIWVFPRKKTFGDQLQVMVSKDDGGEDTGRSYMVYLFGSTWYFAYGKGPGNGFHKVTASGELGFEKWHHIVAVHKTSVGNSLYADGKLVAKDSQGSPLPSNPNTDVILGDSKRSEPWYFYGALDDVMIFETALSESDVKRIHGP